ncbi:hypothetical protein J6TS1_43590 [Siminovitchia terrae]|uniref:Uncharacterized protein n=1 Tax=Siminovitchia terrae TaxID=1914933 RepID=A0ABQ4L3I8_SIMTE|nr:hypothetical protein [Siminovitchia terrae]GIN98489.1 hypothetical protein J6TS1_43590 [Siminovitchia terrae]
MPIGIPLNGGSKPRLNKVKASGGCHRFSEEIYRAMLDKIWAQIRQGAFNRRSAGRDEDGTDHYWTLGWISEKRGSKLRILVDS